MNKQQLALQKIIDDLTRKKTVDSGMTNMQNDLILLSMSATLKESVRVGMIEAISKLVLPVPTVTIDELNIPDIVIPPIVVPEANVIVNVPPINVPQAEVTVIYPKSDEMLTELKSITKAVSVQQIPFADSVAKGMKSIDFRHPMPVILTDHEGKPYIAGSMGGHSSGSAVLKDLAGNVATISKLSETNKALNVAIFNSSGTQVDSFGDTILNVVAVRQVSGAVDSVIVNEIFGSTGTGIINSDNRLRVAVDADELGLTDTELRASTLDVKQLSGSTDSINVVSTVGLTDTQLRASSLEIKQVSGSEHSVIVNSIGVSLEVKQVSGSVDSVIVNSGTLTGITNALEVKQVSGTTDSVSVVGSVSVNVGLTDTELRASTLDVKQVSGSVNSVIVNSIGVSLETKQVSGFSDSIEVHGIARQTNPTAVADAAVVTASYDDLGRQLTRPIQVRDLISTARVQLTTGTEATLLAAGGAGVYYDLIYVMGANTSDAAIGVDFRSVTAGNIEFSLQIPANGTVGVATPVPIPQGNPNNNWTADMGDYTNTTINISALFSKEI